MTQNLLKFNSYCFNPKCRRSQNLHEILFCRYCGSSLRLANRYQAIQVLGQGAYSRTLLAVDLFQTSLTLCVVKQLWSDATCIYPMRSIHELSQQAFQRLEKLEPCVQIPKCLEQFEQDDVLYLVQQYIPGENLALVLAQKGAFNVKEIWQILESLLLVIRQIHACGVIHGDIKPENIICRVPEDGCFNRGFVEDLVLVDVGVAQLLTQVETIQPRTAIGSPIYASPEQLKGKPIFASDLYSLGVTCIHLLTDVHPFSLCDPVSQHWVWRDYWLTDAANEREHLERRQLAQFLDYLIEPVLDRRIASAEQALAEIQHLRGNKRIAPVSRSARPLTWKCCATVIGHRGLFANINAIAIASDGQMLASASDDKTIRLWNMQTEKEQFVLSGHTQCVKTVAFHPQRHNILVSGSRDRTIKFWDLQTHKIIQTLTSHERAVNVVLFSPDGQLLASGSSDKQIKLWNSQTGKTIATLQGHTLAVTALAFISSSSKPLLVSASADSTVKLWNLKTFELVGTIAEHTATVRAVAFSPDGNWLATAGDDRTIRLWDTVSWQHNRTLSGHPWLVSALAFSSDGKTLISGSWDKTVKLWQVSTGDEMGVLTGHKDSISCVAIAPGTNMIVSGSHDRTIKLWSRSY